MLNEVKHLGSILSTRPVIAYRPPRCFAPLSMTGESGRDKVEKHDKGEWHPRGEERDQEEAGRQSRASASSPINRP
jgi:hypothetical protein